ncbi:MAG: UDP-N-acetylglucosamine 1-carboxyvinyltransferase [Puniceicoccaceae bacterium]
MKVFRIEGGHPLEGTIEVSGAKNAALPIFAACLLTDQRCVISNVPDLSDIRLMAELLQTLGAHVERLEPGTWAIEAKTLNGVAPYELVRQMRASICLLGPLVARLREANVSFPGGCVIGPRPIDLHIKGLKKLGCKVNVEGGYVQVDAAELRANHVFLGGRMGSTVTGTANILMAATLAPGVTHIENAAAEPEIADLCRMLQGMGANIEGGGSHTIRIEGVKQLSGVQHRIIPDRVEGGTYLMGAAMTGGDLTVKNLPAPLIGALLDRFEEAGVKLQIAADSIRIHTDPCQLRPVDIITLPFPGFPTDLQAQMCSLMSLVDGLSIITERIYPNRFMHIPELQRMGADIAIEGASAIIKGTRQLSGAPVMASDLRASAALVIAALAAKGESWIQRIYHIERGYERIHEKLSHLGIRMDRLDDTDMPASIQLLD